MKILAALTAGAAALGGGFLVPPPPAHALPDCPPGGRSSAAYPCNVRIQDAVPPGTFPGAPTSCTHHWYSGIMPFTDPCPFCADTRGQPFNPVHPLCDDSATPDPNPYQ